MLHYIEPNTKQSENKGCFLIYSTKNGTKEEAATCKARKRKKMEKQMVKDETKGTSESGKGSIEGLPFEDSPYVKYKDLEDYKCQGYGIQGHQQPKPGRGPGATEAATLSGANVSSQAQSNAADVVHSKGAP